jgi:threonine dehydrogenase-like Zn-dependent dehydrogenase
MRAVVYKGPHHVEVEQVADAELVMPTDVLVRITSTNICGSDLHMYEGRTDFDEGRIIGHENLGEVIEVGSGVHNVHAGDTVCLPFNIGCGFCKNCEAGKTAFCLNANPGFAGAAYGYAKMGPYSGGQAEYLRVPYADFNCLILPEDAAEKENDYVMLTDIFPTGWHATELAGLSDGDSVVVWGDGPVGLMAAYAAVLRDARQVMIVGRQPDRLKLAEGFGAIAINVAETDPQEAIAEYTQGKGADCGCECVGYQAHNAAGEEQPNLTLNNLVKAVRPTGAIGVVGLFVPEDPGAKHEMNQRGQIAFDMGAFFEKGQRMATGQADVKAYNRQLRDLVFHGKAKPSFLISHELGLNEAPNAYKNFDARAEGWTKVILKPGQNAS